MGHIVRFTTNIDAAQRLVCQLNDKLDFDKKTHYSIHEGNNAPHEGLNPLVGDRVLVYEDSNVEVVMIATSREWHVSKGDVVLSVYLDHPPHFQNISAFSKWLRDKGLPTH